MFLIHIEWRRTGDSHVKIFQYWRFYKYKNPNVQNYSHFNPRIFPTNSKFHDFENQGKGHFT